MAGGASDKHDHVQALASDARNSHAVVHAMQAVEGGEDDEEEESMPLDVLQGFAEYVMTTLDCARLRSAVGCRGCLQVTAGDSRRGPKSSFPREAKRTLSLSKRRQIYRT